MAGLNSATIVIYKPEAELQDIAKRSKIPGNNITKNLKDITFASLSNPQTETTHLFEDEEAPAPKEEDMRSFTSRHSKRSIFSRSRRSISKISNLSNLSVASKSSKSRSKRRRDKSRSERKSERKSDDLVSKSSASFLSSKTFYRNRRSRNRNNISQNPSYHGLISKPMSTTHSRRSKTKSSRLDTSGNWRCDHCHYFPNTAFDPHCYKCGALNHAHPKTPNKSRKRTVSTTGTCTTTVSSSPILAPGFNPIHSSNISQRHIIVHSSGDNHTSSDNNDESETGSSYTSSDSSFNTADKAIIVEDYRSKTSQSNSRCAIAQTMDIDDNMDIALPQKSTKTSIDHEPDVYEEDDKSDPDGCDNSDGEVTTDLQTSHHVLRALSNSIPSSLSHAMNVFHWKKKQSPRTPKAEEWNTFQWYLGFKRFILAILYFIVTLEEAFALKHVKGWLSLPLTMC
eukprot:95390_1